MFDNRHPNYAGDVGIGINPKLAARIRDADLIVAIGPRLGEMTTSGYELLAPPRPRQRLVHIHAGAEELGRVYAGDLLINASMACAAPALATLAPPATIRWREWTDAAHADSEANRVPTPVAPLDMAEVIRCIDRHLGDDTIFTNGAGNFAGWLSRFHRFVGMRHAGRTHLAPTSGAMGYGVPAAVAAALLEPQRNVVNIAGDGDFLMTGQELATATAHGLGRGAAKLISIVVDNGTYGTIRMHQEREYPGRVSGSDLGNPDFAALARAYGWFAGERVDTTAAFEPALVAALAADRPALIHLRLDADVITSRTTLARDPPQRRGAPRQDHASPHDRDHAPVHLRPLRRAQGRGRRDLLHPAAGLSRLRRRCRRSAARVATVKCFEDNSLVKAALDEPGNGRVLVVDGGGSLRRALVGGNVAAAAAKNGWAGVVVDGAVRDVAELAATQVGIRALALVPLPTEKRNQGERDVAVQIQGVWVRPGDRLVADADGIVVIAADRRRPVAADGVVTATA